MFDVREICLYMNFPSKSSQDYSFFLLFLIIIKDE